MSRDLSWKCYKLKDVFAVLKDQVIIISIGERVQGFAAGMVSMSVRLEQGRFNIAAGPSIERLNLKPLLPFHT